MAFDVVIAGGGRASAELGQLGHPPSLGDYLEDMSRSGETGGR